MWQIGRVYTHDSKKCWTTVLDYASTYRNGGVGKSGEMT